MQSEIFDIHQISDQPMVIPSVQEERELFEDYEVKSWEYSPRIFKIFGAATLSAFLVVFTFGQFNLMQTRACDNGIVGQVCQVMDAVYIATVLGGKDKEWKVEDYEDSKIEDADITYIDVSNREPKLEYPEGYFALANPEKYSQIPNGDNSTAIIPNPNFPSSDNFGFPSSSPLTTTPNSGNGADLLGKPADLPRQNTDPLKGEMPDSPFGTADTAPTPKLPPLPRYTPPRNNPKYNPRPRSVPSPRLPKLSNDSPKTLPGDDTAAVGGSKDRKVTKPEKSPQPKPETTPFDPSTMTAERINKKPLQDFAEDVLVKTDGKDKIDLTKAFVVEMDGVLGADGKLDLKKSRFIRGEGDEKMIDVAKSAIEAVNTSGLLSYMKDMGVEKVNFILFQDDKQLSAIIRADQPTVEKAQKVTSGMNGAIAIVKLTNRDEDLATLVNASKFSTEGKSFVMNFALPKDAAHKLIGKKLQEARLKKSQTNSGDATSNIPPQGR